MHPGLISKLLSFRFIIEITVYSYQENPFAAKLEKYKAICQGQECSNRVAPFIVMWTCTHLTFNMPEISAPKNVIASHS